MATDGLILQTSWLMAHCPLGRKASTVQIDRERMDEGEQAEQRQTDVHLQSHKGREIEGISQH